MDLPKFFPDPHEADEQGLLGIGGSLEPEWLLDAYTHGIFPWPFGFGRQMHLGWFFLDPRCVFEFERFHVSRRLEATIRSGRFQVTSDTDFESVIRGCAASGPNRGSTWITPEMIEAFCRMHRLGYAHSVEAWSGGELAGGVYGIAVGGLFAAESMFFRKRDASKVALVALVRHLQRQGFRLMDIQMLTDHTATFGAVEISGDEYLRRLQRALRVTPDFGRI